MDEGVDCFKLSDGIVEVFVEVITPGIALLGSPSNICFRLLDDGSVTRNSYQSGGSLYTKHKRKIQLKLET